MLALKSAEIWYLAFSERPSILSPIYADFWSQQKNDFSASQYLTLGADYIAPFERCSGTILRGQ